MQNRGCLFIHLFRQKILGRQHSDICILLFFLQYRSKQACYFRTVLVCLLRTQNKLAHNVHLCIAIHIIIQQNSIQLYLIQTILPFFLVIRSHRKQRRRIARFFLQYFLISFVCFFFLTVVQIDISQNGKITHVIWIFFRQILNLRKCLLIIVHGQIHAEFLHADLFRLPIQGFKAVQCINYLLIILGTGIEINQSHQRFQT